MGEPLKMLSNAMPHACHCHRECVMPQQKLIMWPLAGTWYALWPTAIEKTLNAIFSQ